MNRRGTTGDAVPGATLRASKLAPATRRSSSRLVTSATASATARHPTPLSARRSRGVPKSATTSRNSAKRGTGVPANRGRTRPRHPAPTTSREGEIGRRPLAVRGAVDRRILHQDRLPVERERNVHLDVVEARVRAAEIGQGVLGGGRSPATWLAMNASSPGVRISPQELGRAHPRGCRTEESDHQARDGEHAHDQQSLQ